MRGYYLRYRFYQMIIGLLLDCLRRICKRSVDGRHMVDDPLFNILLEVDIGSDGVGDVLEDKHHLVALHLSVEGLSLL